MFGLFFRANKKEWVDEEKNIFLDPEPGDEKELEVCDKIRSDTCDFELIDMDYDYEE